MVPSAGTPVLRSAEYHTRQLGSAAIRSMTGRIAGTRHERV